MNIISDGLNYLLNYIFSFTGDWGLAIVLLTLLVKVLLLPITLKQKASIENQQDLSEKINELKIKYKNDKNKLEQEIQNQYKENAQNMWGCFISILQIPIISALYFVIMRMPVEASTMIVPWVSTIKITDKYFIIPMIYVFISLCPSFLSYTSYFGTLKRAKVTKNNMVIMSLFSLIVTVKAPIAIGLYFITTGLFSFIEEVGYRIYMKNKNKTLLS